MDKFRSMDVFVAVADAGSFTAAARQFDISPVMVGKHIVFLEQSLGTRLLARTTRRQALTEIGKHYCEQCRAILAQVRIAESGAEAMHSKPRGTLKISAAVSFGGEWLTPLLVEYLEQHKDVKLDLQLNDRIVDLVEDGIDAAFRIAVMDNSGLVARLLRPYTMCICASPAYLERQGTPQTPDELAHHQCLDFSNWPKDARWRLKGNEDGAIVPPSRFRSNNGRALRRAALAGFGITMQAELLLAEDIAAGRLVPLLQAFLPPARPLYLVYPRDRLPTAKLSSFIDFVLRRCT